jgi:uncharacterized protein
MTVRFVDEQLHRGGTSAFLAAASRRVSLVDCVSFELMRYHGIRRAFAFDRTLHPRGSRSFPDRYTVSRVNQEPPGPM